MSPNPLQFTWVCHNDVDVSYECDGMKLFQRRYFWASVLFRKIFLHIVKACKRHSCASLHARHHAGSWGYTAVDVLPGINRVTVTGGQSLSSHWGKKHLARSSQQPSLLAADFTDTSVRPRPATEPWAPEDPAWTEWQGRVGPSASLSFMLKESPWQRSVWPVPAAGASLSVLLETPRGLPQLHSICARVSSNHMPEATGMSRSQRPGYPGACKLGYFLRVWLWQTI